MSRTETYLVRYIVPGDCDVVLGRVPAELKTRLRDVFTHHDSRGMHVLGWVRTHGRRDINLAGMLPPRMSLRRCVGRHRGNSAREFGAPATGQWPPWAVRRYLLYHTLLHELGHLQVVAPRARRNQRRYASEGAAHTFANAQRRELYARWYDHTDPVHNPPTEAELSFIQVWERLDKSERRRLVDLARSAPHESVDLAWLGAMTDPQRSFINTTLRGQRLAEHPPGFIDRRDLPALRRFAAAHRDVMAWDLELAWNTAWAFDRLGAADQALPILETALLLAPEDGLIWFGLGVAHRSLNNLIEAERCLRASLDRRESWLTRLALAATLLALDRPAEGEALLRTGLAIRANPKPRMHLELADYLDDIGSYIEADLIRSELLGT